MRWFRMILAGFCLAVCAPPAFAAGVQALDGNWARDDGSVKINIAACGGNECAVNTYVAPSDTKERVGDKLILTLQPDADGNLQGQAYDVRRQKGYAVTISVQGQAMRIKGCILAGILCKAAGYTRIN